MRTYAHSCSRSYLLCQSVIYTHTHIHTPTLFTHTHTHTHANHYIKTYYVSLINYVEIYILHIYFNVSLNNFLSRLVLLNIHNRVVAVPLKNRSMLNLAT